jgi:hypothetical protein
MPDWDDWRAWFRIDVPGDIKRTKELVFLVKYFLSTHFQAFIERLDKRAQEGGDEVYEAHEDELWKLSTVFPDTIWNSLFVTCFSYLEEKLNSLCEHHLTERKGKLKNAKRKTRNISKSKGYLCGKDCGISISKPTWTEILNYETLRDCIVHRIGKLNATEKQNTKLIDFIRKSALKNATYREPEIYSITSTPKFCLDFLQLLGRFFNDLSAKLPSEK